MAIQIKYSKQAVKAVKKLPSELIKRFVLAWDPDFTKATPDEQQRMKIAEKELEKGESFSHDEVWADL